MSLLDKASLIVTPNAYKTSKLYSVVPNTTLGDMDVVRATTATRVNSAGLIEVVPRNLLTYSEQFENANWVKSGSGTASAPVVSTNSVISPINIQNAEKITFDLNGGTSSSDLSWLYQNVSTIIGLTYTFSAYVKASLIDDIGKQIRIGGITYSNTITLTSSWQRVSITETATNINTSFGFRLRGTEITNDVSMDLWGGQAENLATATEYFPTTTRLNIPRIDYTNGSCPSILVEPQRTNLNLYSEDFGNAYWTLFAATRTLNVVNSPSGIQNADKLIEDNTNSFHSIYLPSNFTVTVGQAYTRTIYAKADGRNWISLLIVDSSQYRAFFDLQNGVIGNISSGITAKITNAGNGWYRCEITRVAATVSLSSMAIELAISNGTGSYLGNGTSGVYLWGAQIELGSYATSYVPTVASTITRNADVISKTGISSLIGQTEGTVFVDINIDLSYTQNDMKFINISDGTSTNWWFIGTNVSNQIRFYYKTGATTYVSQLVTLTSGRHKLVFAYKSNDYVAYVDGTQVYSLSSLVVGATSQIDLGNGFGGGNISKQFINSAQLYKTRLTNTELQSLTTL
jgi:hypothetical protein